MKYTIRAALLGNNGPESEFHTDNLVDSKLLYRALRAAGHRPIRLIENGYFEGPHQGSKWVRAAVLWTVENGIETAGAPRPVG